jgi:hypothetical protein
MKMILRPTLNILAVLVFTLLVGSVAQAQATRTWVSGVGDDVNPCSRTAPCKTFAGAISKTFINGEIDCLDEGGFGTITITKSLTIEGTVGGGFGSILASGTTGVNVNLTSTTGDDPTRTVRLRHLSINGTGSSGTVGTRTGINGIRIFQSAPAPAADVYIEGCLITSFSQRGISDERTSGNLYVTDTIVRDNAQIGIVVTPAAGASTVNAVFERVRSQGNDLSGIFVGAGSKSTLRDSVVTQNANAGIQVDGANTVCNIVSSIISHNTAFGLFAGSNASLTRLHDVTITNNGNGISLSGGAVESSGNNTIRGNTTGNPPFGAGFTTPGQS